MRILLVEDNPAEARLTREALNHTGVAHELAVVGDGETATAFLLRRGEFARVQRPHLVLLDLNLPCKDGREVLREVKEDPALASIPVIVITNSQAQEDIQQVYQLKGNCYLVKPPDLEEFFVMMKRVMEFWWTTARIPAGFEVASGREYSDGCTH
ncbi:MAG: response regulator [Verrucomicrobiae bacterium]|nr:response regulator [Verrucomicrobiae bacterium]